MEKVLNIMLTDINMMVNGKKDREVVMVFIIFQMETNIKANLKKIKKTVKVFKYMSAVENTMVFG
jgi:hypothetical protein